MRIQLKRQNQKCKKMTNEIYSMRTHGRREGRKGDRKEAKKKRERRKN